MSKKTPALHLLTIFEASARHESFKLASEELFITPSAVSHQIKALEEFIGFPLFLRKSRRVKLNDAGKLYLDYVQQSLALIEKGTRKVKQKFASPTLRITTFPTMASNVIIPQLSLFQNSHPDIDIRLSTGMNLIDIHDEDFDLAIRVGGDKVNHSIAKKLVDINVAAVCSKSFAVKHKLTNVKQINEVPLINLSYMEDMWQQWSTAANIQASNFSHKLTLGSYESTLQAAEQGLGLALALLPIENSLIEREILIDPFAIQVPFPQSLYAVYREEDKDRHDIQCFINWLVQSPNMKLNNIA
ncbi:LysR substrate-binding domain-containing protein [Thalassotalea ganghwensis]